MSKELLDFGIDGLREKKQKIKMVLKNILVA